jgi:hypothetical protein
MLDAYSSERGVPAELDPTLQPEGELLLRGIIIEVAPGVPATEQAGEAAGRGLRVGDSMSTQ